MRSKKVFLNILAAIIELIVVTVTSFIIPHYIIRAYGSSVNGLISSITQFLAYIALIESGIGAVGRASLYKPLASGSVDVLSGNVKAIESFYRNVAYAFLVYVAFLSILFPALVKQEFDWIYTATLIMILAIRIFIQYYFGITNQTVIQADQKKYIPSLLQALTLFLNMIITVILIGMGADIHTVMIGSAFAYAIRPMILYFYVNNHYRIDRKVKPRNEVLKQRWDGLAQHIAFFIHKNTDIAVLTILTSVTEVSVYSIYMLAVSGCAKVVNIFSASLEPAFGNMIAKGEKGTLKSRVSLCSMLTIQVTIILFSTAAIIVSPFIKLYTRDITDANYLRPSFGLVMLIAEALYCIRMPYQSAVYAAGHFKQTRNGAIIEAVANIVISVILVFRHGLIGVAIGTLVSMTFRTAQYIWYYHCNLIKERAGLLEEAMRVGITILEILVIFVFYYFIPEVPYSSYVTWIIASCSIGIGCTLIVSVSSLFFYKKECVILLNYAKRLICRSR